MSVGVLPVGHVHSNVTSGHTVVGASVHGAHEADSAHIAEALALPPMGPGQLWSGVSTHELVPGHQKQLTMLGVVHVSHVVYEPQLGGIAHVVSFSHAFEGHVDVFTYSRQPLTDWHVERIRLRSSSLRRCSRLRTWWVWSRCTERGASPQRERKRPW